MYLNEVTYDDPEALGFRKVGRRLRRVIRRVGRRVRRVLPVAAAIAVPAVAPVIAEAARRREEAKALARQRAEEERMRIEAAQVDALMRRRRAEEARLRMLEVPTPTRPPPRPDIVYEPEVVEPRPAAREPQWIIPAVLGVAVLALLAMRRG
jgi:hypothetical protein